MPADPRFNRSSDGARPAHPPKPPANAAPAPGAPGVPESTIQAARTRRSTVSGRQSPIRPASPKTSERTASATASGAADAAEREIVIAPRIGVAVGVQKYRVGDELGRGGLGAVRAATDTVLLREVAIKWLLSPDDAKAREAFFEEAQITGQLEHPNIVPVHELGIDAQNLPYLAMKRIRGRTFRDVIAEADREIRWATKAGADVSRRASTIARAERRLLDCFVKMCDAVAYAHSRGVVHRDLKPANVMVGEFGEVLVVDWGLAKPLRGRERTVVTDRRTGGADVTVQGDVFGTPQYMSPRQAMGENAEIDERDDIYALGAILFHMLAGKPAFEGPVMKVLTDVAQGKWPLPSEIANGRPVPRELEAVVVKAMALDPDARYPTVADLKGDIEAYLAGKTLTAADYSSWQLLAKWAARNKGIVTTMAVAGAVLVAVVTVFVVGLSAERDRADGEAAAARDAERRATAAAIAAHEAAHRAEAEAQRAKSAQATADDHAAQARSARAQAERDRDSARDAESQARRQFAEALVAEGDALMIARREFQAGEKYLRAQHEFAELGLSTLRADLGLADRFRLLPTELLAYEGHQGQVLGIAISPDGKTAISGGADQTIRVWEVRTGRMISSTAAHRGGVSSVAFAPDGRFAASAGSDGLARVYDLNTGAVSATCSGHTNAISRLAFSPDGTRLVTAGMDNTVRVWDARTGHEIAIFSDHFRYVIDAKFVPGTTWVISAGADNVARLFDLTTGRELRQFHGHLTWVKAVDVTPDGKSAVTAGIDGTLRVWEIATGREMLTIDAHRGWIEDVKISADGTMAVSGSRDETIRQWELSSGREISVLRSTMGHAHAVSIAADATFAISADSDGKLRAWPLRRQNPAHLSAGYRGTVNALALTSDARLMASSDSAGQVKLWDLASGTEIRSFRDGGRGAATAIALNADGTRLAAAIHLGDTGAIEVWDTRSGVMVANSREPGGRKGLIGSLAFLPDGSSVLMSYSKEGGILVYDSTANRVVTIFAGHFGGEVPGVAVVPGGKFAVSGSHDGTIKLWELASGQEIRTVATTPRPIYSVSVSPDGKFVAVGCTDATARVFELATGEPTAVLIGHQTLVRTIGFSPDGALLVTGSADRSVKLWNLAEQREWRSWADHSGEVSAVEFSADGRFIISGAADGRVVVREIAGGLKMQAWAERLAECRATLATSPADATALRALGEWFAFRSMPAFALEAFSRARRGGATVSALEMARLHAGLGQFSDARTALAAARAANEAPHSYLDIFAAGLLGRE